MGNSGTGTTLINPGLLSTPATLAVSLFIDNNDNNQLIKFHLHQWTTNPISKHHHNTDRGMRIWESGLNNSEIDLCTSSPDNTWWFSEEEKPIINVLFYLCKKPHMPFLIMTYLYIHILYTNIYPVHPTFHCWVKSSPTQKRWNCLVSHFFSGIKIK